MSAIERSASHLDATTSFPPRAERRRRPSTHLGTGAVLTVLAYLKHGWLGAGLLVSLTFVLHKIEAYYLNPRLTARHVALPVSC